MKDITVKDIVKATKGRLLWGREQEPVEHVSFDSRRIEENTLFVPLPGERTDGCRFIESAFLNGAKAVVTSRHEKETVPEHLREYAWILVEDTKKALQAVGSYYRGRLTLPIVGITGSVGKTTTRAMMAAALEGSLKVFQTKGNLNSQLGVPVMLTETGDEDISVLEMGMSEFGEMERLSHMVRPDMAVITCIGVAHIEQLETMENIRNEKLAITKGMKPEGILLLNGDDAMLAGIRGSLPQTVYYYGTGSQCEFRAEDVRIVKGRAEFTAVLMGERVPVSLAMPGSHNVLNALAALAVVKLNHASVEAGAGMLSRFEGVSMRQQIYTLDSCTVIDDSYNANPDSMRAGIRVLMELPAEGRKVAVLGDMLELGAQKERFHREVGRFAAAMGVDHLITFGPLSCYMEEGARETSETIQIRHFDSREEIILYLKKLLCPQDTVLLKGSRGMKLNQVADALRKAAGKEA